jgi:hypothetical protein
MQKEDTNSLSSLIMFEACIGILVIIGYGGIYYIEHTIKTDIKEYKNELKTVDTLPETEKIEFAKKFIKPGRIYQTGIKLVKTPGAPFPASDTLSALIENAIRYNLKPENGIKSTLKIQMDNLEISKISHLGVAISGKGTTVNRSTDPEKRITENPEVKETYWTAYLEFFQYD